MKTTLIAATILLSSTLAYAHYEYYSVANQSNSRRKDIPCNYGSVGEDAFCYVEKVNTIKSYFRSVPSRMRKKGFNNGKIARFKREQKVFEKKSKGLSSEKIITDEIVEVIENDDSTEEGINRLMKDNFKTSVEKSVEDYIYAKPKDILKELTRLEDSNLHILDVMPKVNAELKYGKVTVKPEVSAKFGFGLKSDLFRLTNIEGKGKLNVEYMW